MRDLRRSTSADHVDLFACRIFRGQGTGAKSFQRDYHHWRLFAGSSQCGIDLAIDLVPRDRYVGEADNVPKVARRIRKRLEVSQRVQR